MGRVKDLTSRYAISGKTINKRFGHIAEERSRLSAHAYVNN